MKPDEDRASERLELRINADVKAAWQIAADQAEMKLSAWIKDRLDKIAQQEIRQKKKS